MCRICGDLSDALHWSARVAGAAGDDDSATRQRWRRIRVLAEVLRPFALDVADGAAGTVLVLSSRTGATEVVSGLSEVWPATERLRSAPVDVLDAAYLRALESAGGPGGRR